MSRERSRPWTNEALVPVWSATKGPAALCCLLAIHEAHLSLETPVADIWPEFFLHGKEHITLAQVLSHRAGLFALTEKVPFFDYDSVITALERQAPLTPPGEVQAYHPRTWGFLVDEIVRRITGAETLGHYFREVLGDPLGLDFWIGLPHVHHSRVATLYPGKMNLGADDQTFLKAFNTAGTLTQRAFASPIGLEGIHEMNKPESWLPGYPALGGVGSAKGLAALYAVLANGGKFRGQQVIPTWVLQALQKSLSQAHDEVLQTTISFSAGQMLDPIDPETGSKTRSLFGDGVKAHGHPGAGGSIAWADPDSGVAFAYVMNQMETGVLPGPKVKRLTTALSGL